MNLDPNNNGKLEPGDIVMVVSTCFLAWLFIKIMVGF